MNFCIRDIYHPDPAILLQQLGGVKLSGKVVGVFRQDESGTPYAVVEVEDVAVGLIVMLEPLPEAPSWN